MDYTTWSKEWKKAMSTCSVEPGFLDSYCFITCILPLHHADSYRLGVIMNTYLYIFLAVNSTLKTLQQEWGHLHLSYRHCVYKCYNFVYLGGHMLFS